MHKRITLFTLGIAFLGCSAPESSPDRTEALPEPTVSTDPVEGTFCFLKALNKDSTFVKLTVQGDSVLGSMRWRPWEKDGATGSLSGLRNAEGELELIYDYMIEGQHQTETKVMKMEGSLLWIKTGQLVDPNNDGHLHYADVSKATYSEQAVAVQCR
ncbi:MAG: hypothetical protein JNM62_10405 [Flavobacteriales bacterium]|nr:hypothetical protein [Flavobacteriales bacterium]